MNTHSPNGPDTAGTASTVTFTPSVGQAHPVAAGTGAPATSRTDCWPPAPSSSGGLRARLSPVVVGGIGAVLAAVAVVVALLRRKRG